MGHSTGIARRARLVATTLMVAALLGAMVAAACLRLVLVDEVRYSILPVLIGDGIPFFGNLDADVALHLAEVKAQRSGIVDLCYEVRRRIDAHGGLETTLGVGT